MAARRRQKKVTQGTHVETFCLPTVDGKTRMLLENPEEEA